MSVHKPSVDDQIERYKRHITKATDANDNDKIMSSIIKLSKLPINVQNLQKTGIGRVVNSLRKYDGDLGEAAKSLVIKWKNVVKEEESENLYQRDENSDEEPHDVSTPNINEGLQIDQSIISNVASTSYYKNNHNKNTESELGDENNGAVSDKESSRHRHHDKSKSKKSKKDKDTKKRKDSNSTPTDDQSDGNVSKKMKREHKYESVKTKKESETQKFTSTTKHRENNSSEENVKKDKKSSHSDKKKDKHKSSQKSESKSYKDKHEPKSSHKEKNESKKNKDKLKKEPSPSASCSNNKTFEEALLGIEIVKKKQVKSKCRDRSSSSERSCSPFSSSMKLAPLNLDPEELITNYKPLPQLDRKMKRTLEDTDPLMTVMTPKNKRTKVYSGNKSTFYTEVPTLVECCLKIIKENIDALEYTGGVPFEILEPILKQVSCNHLYRLEDFNPYLIEDTGELWEFHCKKEFRNKIPGKNESWRDFYIRCLEEREIKFANIRHNINANKAASTPVRKTQLAYVDSVVKPPRYVAKKQAKFNASTETKRNILNKAVMGGNSTAEALITSNRPTTMATNVPVAVGSNSASSSQGKKGKKAPLMQKALQLIKSRYKR